MQELIAHTRQLTDEQGNPLTFRYTLLENHTQEGDIDYGIGIDSSLGNQICLPHLSVDRGAVESLLALAAHLTLSPTHLPDVVEDWLGQ